MTTLCPLCKHACMHACMHADSAPENCSSDNAPAAAERAAAERAAAALRLQGQLHEAAQRGQLGKARQLLGQGADVNENDAVSGEGRCVDVQRAAARRGGQSADKRLLAPPQGLGQGFNSVGGHTSVGGGQILTHPLGRPSSAAVGALSTAPWWRWFTLVLLWLACRVWGRVTPGCVGQVSAGRVARCPCRRAQPHAQPRLPLQRRLG